MTTGNEDSLGLRERKKRQTRLALSRATIRLGVERGWNNVTVEDIAADVGVSVRTFRNYFSSKAEAVAASHVERALRIAEQLRTRPAAEDLWDAITNAVLTQFAPLEDITASPAGNQRWRDGVRLMLAEPALQGEIVRANAAAEDALTEAIAERVGVDATGEVYPRLVAAVISAGISAAVQHSLRAEPPIELGPVLRDVFARITAGLPVP